MPTPKWQGIFEVWEGGLGVWGGILLGTLAGVRRRAAAPALAPRSWTRPRPDCCSPRESAGSATGGTRSSTASRRRSRGASRSTSTTRVGLAAPVPGTRRPTSRRSSTSFSGTSPASSCSCGSRAATASGRRRCFALYVAYYCFGRFFEELLRIDPSHHVPRAAAQRLGLDRLLRRARACSSSGGSCSARGGDGGDRPPPRRRRPPPRPEGPRMAIPRGRVR